MLGVRLLFKCENFQKAGAFKFRGATNAIQGISEEVARRGVATHSSGNHAGALALAARQRNIKAHVVMPSNAPRVKQDATRGYGAEVTLCEPTLAAREAALQEVLSVTGAEFIHPYNDPRIIAGQGTAVLELLEDHPDLEVVITPVGGGGLLAGSCLAVQACGSSAVVIGAEPMAADDAVRSLAAGRIIPANSPRSIADGLLTSLGSGTFPIIQENVRSIMTATEAGIASATRLIWERMKILVEPSAAVPLAVLMENPGALSGKRIGIVLSGGNVDLDNLPWNRVG